MLLSIALILIVGMSMGFLCQKIKLPSLLGMLVLAPQIMGASIVSFVNIPVSIVLGIAIDLSYKKLLSKK